MNLYPEKWLALPDGSRYQGETLADSLTPHGLGIITLGDDLHFYAGEFAHGKRHGRGFTLTHKKWEAVESVWINGSYEEVMATAEFDSCGRVIHCDRVGHYEKCTVHHEQWIKDCDGRWADDTFIEPCAPDALKRAPWKWAMTLYDYDDYGHPIEKYSDVFTKHIADAGSDGRYSFNGHAYVTVADDEHLLFCDCSGHVFKLGLNETHDYHRGRELHSVHLCLDEPRYGDLFENMRFDELVATALTFSTVMSEKAAKYFLRVFYMRSSVFMLSDESIEMIRRAADAGNRYAQFAYGRYHDIKKVDENSGTISLKYLQMARDQGLYDATAALSLAWDFGDMGMVDRSKSKQLLLEALEHESDFAAVLQLNHLLYGHHGSSTDPTTALEAARGLRDRDAKAGTPSGLSLYYIGLALNSLNRPDAGDYLTHAARMGVADAWYDLALMKAKFGDDGTVTNLPEFRDVIYEGTKHHSPECFSQLAAMEIDEFTALSDEQRTDELAQEIIDMLEKAHSWGSSSAAFLLGQVYYYGDLNREEDNQTAWMWYARAALWNNMEAFEKMFAMVHDHYIYAEQSFCDHLAINGARLGSKKFLAETVMAYTHGRLTEYAAEIEQYYCPVFDSDGFTINDDNEGDETPEPTDDDGRFDAWA